MKLSVKILFDIGHPAHIHYFRLIIELLKKNNHKVFISARDKEMTHELLVNYGFDFINRRKGKRTILGKLLYLFHANYIISKFALKVKPDLFVGFGSPYAAQVAFLFRKPSLIFDDTENAKFGQMFYRPFASTILSPSTFKPNFGIKHIKFNSYMELCYLHPNYFKAEKEELKKYGIDVDEKYIVIRFVSWNANHDIGHYGISAKNKINAVNEFSKYGKVYISTEQTLPKQLEKYKLKIPPEIIHNLLAFASLFYGESATMASESAILGTPAIYIDNQGRGYTDEQQDKYGLVFNYSESINDQALSIKKGVSILKSKSYNFRQRCQSLIEDKLDTTSFIYWFIENYPNSFKTMKANPDFQNRFLTK